MRRTIALACGLLLVAASTTTSAFEEQQLKTQPTAKADGGSAAAKPSLAGKALEFKAPETKPEAGTKIRIPGLGVIGEIPKIDLGLDLLYGATDPKRSDLDRGEGQGVMVRGKIQLQSR